jgi:hypothetical protein
MAQTPEQVQQERLAAAGGSDEIFRLMRGDGNQSRINDGRSNSSYEDDMGNQVLGN